MSRIGLSLTVVFAATLSALAASSARAQGTDETVSADGANAQAMPADYAEPGYAEQEGSPPPIPPYVDAPPVTAQGGGYCFEGPHPVDSRVEPGVTWDSTTGRHLHGYPPFDMRLFSFQNGCYYFIGDPTDFGYAGNTYSYYGAHPILGIYGGGWCFMIGPHHHFWRPWSSLFVTVGPWYYWEGAYDPFFWTYWPFYHHYYRNYYPGYYSHGAFFRGHAVAPRITSVPRPMTRSGAGWHGAGAGMRGGVGAPRNGMGAPRPGMPRGPAAVPGAGMAPHRGAMPAPGGGVGPRSFSPPSGGGFAPRGFAPPAAGGGFAPRTFSPPSGGGFAPRGGGFSPPSGGGFAPRGGGFSAPARPSGGGFGGGHFGGGRSGGGFGGGGFGRGGRR